MPDWDKRYAKPGPALFGEAPNEYVREIFARSDFAALSAICLADGDGRNGRWLAQQGLTVDAVDLSSVATELARDKDARAGVSVSRLTVDISQWRPEPERAWDAAFQIYLQADPVTRKAAVRLAAEHLRPGGWFVLEAFGTGKDDGVDTGAMGPDDDALRYSVDELTRWLAGFQFIEALTGRVLLDEGERHRGEAWVVRFAARKPG
jgi:SAM-dependent methyltransferase